MTSAEPGPRHLALVGTTATGKSAVALAVARQLAARGEPVELVSADSMQVYRGMDIGTAKPSPSERAEIPHHLVDVADPSEDWSVSRFQAAVAEAVAGIERRGRRALLVGGTGLYVQAVIDGLAVPGRFPEVRAELEAELEQAAPAVLAGLYHRLERLDPLAASRIEPTNRRRVVRALEVTLGSGRPFSSYGPGLDAYPATRWRLVGLWLPRRVVDQRISQRLNAMVKAGFVEEVQALLDRPGGLSATARQALGYREIVAHLEQGEPLPAALSEAERRTRLFARRQQRWWRRDPRVAWLGAAENSLAVVPALVGEWSRP